MQTEEDHLISRGPELKAASRPERANSTALDQWRGFALLCVLVSHGWYFTNRVHGFGRVGVNLFFFISGILVYRSLASKTQLTSTERSVAFWKSRLRRLYPAMLGYVFAMMPVVYVMQHYERSLPLPDFADYLRGLPFALGCFENYAPGMPMSLGHLWSISCEMQFYLLAPLIFMAGGNSARRKNLIWGGLLAILVSLGIAQPAVGDSVKYHFEFAVWPMILGFVCEHQKALFSVLPRRPIQMMIRFALILFVVSSGAMIATGRFKNIVIALGAVMFVPCFDSYVNGRCLKGLLGRSLAWIGARTYSIYLWQQPLTICRYLPNVLHPIGALAAIALGGVWFRLLERPFLSAKRRQVSAIPANQLHCDLQELREAGQSESFIMFLSVIICSHNPRLDYLNQTLAALQQQTLSLPYWELLIVDNKSDEPLTSRIFPAGMEPGRIIREETLGLTAARLRGIREAKGDLLVFVDDDNVLAPDYLETANTLASAHPRVGVFSANIEPEYESPPPAGIGHFEPYLAIRRLSQDIVGTETGPDILPIGAGMVVRRSVALAHTKLLGNDGDAFKLGRKGNSLSAGEDTHLGYTAFDIGFACGAFQKLKLRHLIGNRRLRPEYLEKLVEDVLYSQLCLAKWRGAPQDSFILFLRRRVGLIFWSLAGAGPYARFRRAVLRARLRLARDI